MDSTHNSETLEGILRGGPQDLAISEPGQSANQRTPFYLAWVASTCGSEGTNAFLTNTTSNHGTTWEKSSSRDKVSLLHSNRSVVSYHQK
ncbi:hypothetical protein Syun_014910 [Stephania yunnanensis]|uniref:Uncharacterized protein n=1 Tax=Stephania yunnanensis TaxID=152371 RepID=A0AAP0PCA6_9MAGN